MKSENLRGILPAIPTPVHSDSKVNVDAVKKHVAYLLHQEIDGLVPLGGTGEYGALSRAERVRMASICVESVGGKVPVIPGVLDTGYFDAIEAGKSFSDVGADALMVLTPYYTNPTQAGIRDYFLRFADESPLPILIYEIPYRTRIAIEPSILHELSKHERIIGMKACNTDMYHFLQVTAGVDDSFAVLSGEDTLLPLHLAAGAKGGIVVTASMLPRAWRTIYELVLAGNITEAIKLHRKLIPMMNLAFAETNPGPMKSVMDLIGVQAPAMLAPLVEPAPELQEKLRAEMKTQLAMYESLG
ncbi:MAG: 4-hydroxy-tetrahydrodipicolinate synthase [Comamonadaceae bacterium]|nr:4-hydroxy-tetrahydrodipicolinate synthase [Comamonadaceae bacterium]